MQRGLGLGLGCTSCARAWLLLDLGVGLCMRLCLALGLALGLGLALALCLLCLLWPWFGPVGAAWVVLSGRFSTSFLGFGQVRLIHKDGGECFTACEVVSQNCGFCFFV